jgi:hypothetical protein
VSHARQSVPCLPLLFPASGDCEAGARSRGREEHEKGGGPGHPTKRLHTLTEVPGTMKLNKASMARRMCPLLSTPSTRATRRWMSWKRGTRTLQVPHPVCRLQPREARDPVLKSVSHGGRCEIHVEHVATKLDAGAEPSLDAMRAQISPS